MLKDIKESESEATPITSKGNSFHLSTDAKISLNVGKQGKPPTKRKPFRSKTQRHKARLSPAPLSSWLIGSPGNSSSEFREDFQAFLRVTSSFKYYQLHPVNIPYIDRNKEQRIYTPLMYLEYWDHDGSPRNRKSLLADIWSDYDIRANGDWIIPAWSAAHRFASERKLRFQVFRDKFFSSEYYSNIRFIERYIGAEPDESNWLFAEELLQTRGRMSLSDLVEFVEFQDLHVEKFIDDIWTLVLRGDIRCDQRRTFGLETLLWID